MQPDGNIEKKVVSQIPFEDYQNDKYNALSGMLVVPLEKGVKGEDLANGSLSLVGTFNGKEVTLLEEDEWRIVPDKSTVYFEHPNPKTGENFEQIMNFTTYKRGVPASKTFYLYQFYDPLGMILVFVLNDLNRLP